MVCDSIMLKN